MQETALSKDGSCCPIFQPFVEMNKNRKLLISLFITAAVICAVIILCVLADKTRDAKRNEILADSAFFSASSAESEPSTGLYSETIFSTENSPSATATEITAELPQETSSYVSPVDFGYLKSVNPEIYAWLNIDSTDISYPVAQHADPGDRDFYLYTGYDLTANQTGTIYSIPGECGKGSGQVFILYGHNQSKFSELKNYRDVSYWNDHRYIVLYLENEEKHYEVFAFAAVNDILLTDEYDFASREGIKEFLNYLWANETTTSHLYGSCSADDQIIILSTCIPGHTDQRFLVVGRQS